MHYPTTCGLMWFQYCWQDIPTLRYPSPYWSTVAICLYIHNFLICIKTTHHHWAPPTLWFLNHWWLKNTHHLLWRQLTKTSLLWNHRGFACEDINWVNRSNCQPWQHLKWMIRSWPLRKNSHGVGVTFFFCWVGMCVLLIFCVGLV